MELEILYVEHCEKRIDSIALVDGYSKWFQVKYVWDIVEELISTFSFHGLSEELE